jgi:hypothetical protein
VTLGRVALSFSRGAACAAMALALFASAGNAQTRVGVTSATDGAPLGKPPQQAERVLRIGVDVQANEAITTANDDRAHLVFLDGTSLTVGPNARLVIDKYVFDPNSRTGELAINASKGVFRLVGGKISKSTPITITTPSSAMAIRGGITIFDVRPSQTSSTFVFGNFLTVTSQGGTQNLTRPGSQVITDFGFPPGAPILLAQGALAAQLAQLEGRGGGSPSGQTNASNTNQVAQSSGFSASNSGQPVQLVGLQSGQSLPVGPTPAFLNTITASILPATNDQQQTIQAQAMHAQAAAAQQTSVATYVGTLSGAVTNGYYSYMAQGTYQNVWSFGSRSGVATINFDGAQYGGGSTPNTFAVGNTSYFAGAMNSTSGPSRQLGLVGTFGSTPGSPAQNQTGVFAATDGANYGAVGTFSATR